MNENLPQTQTQTQTQTRPTLLFKLDEAGRRAPLHRPLWERQIATRRLAVVHIGRSVRIAPSWRPSSPNLREQERGQTA